MNPARRILTLAVVGFLVGCLYAVVLKAQYGPTDNRDLYRVGGAVLRLSKGTIVDSIDGKYMALTDERWFSEQQCLALQKENATLHLMLSQARNLRQ